MRSPIDVPELYYGSSLGPVWMILVSMTSHAHRGAAPVGIWDDSSYADPRCGGTMKMPGSSGSNTLPTIIIGYVENGISSSSELGGQLVPSTKSMIMSYAIVLFGYGGVMYP